MKKTIGFVVVFIQLFLPFECLLAQESKLPDNFNGVHVTPEKVPVIDDILRKNPSTIYRTIDGLIIDNYQVQKIGNGEVKVEMNIFNPLMITGKVKIYNSNGTLDKDSKYNTDIDALSNIGKNIIDQGAKMEEEFVRAAQGKDGTFLDIFRYSALDPRTNIRSQEKPIILKSGQTLEITNRDQESLLLQKAEAIYDLIFAAAKLKYKPDESIKKRLLLSFAEALGKELNTPIIASDINLLKSISEGKPLDKIVNKIAFEKTIAIFNKVLETSKKTIVDPSYDTLTDILSDGTGVVLKAIGAGGVGVASDLIYKGVSIGVPLIKLDIIGKIEKLPNSPGILIANNNGEISYPTSIVKISTPLNTYPTDLIQNNITSITQGGSSHIGSASYYLGKSPNQDPKIELEGIKLKSVQENEQYTTPAGSITNLKAPVDVVLNWNQSVAAGQLDLDSHLTGPTSLGDDSSVRFHTYWDSKGSSTTAPYVLLYRDVIPADGGFGAEQTRIQVLQNGIYRFYVHDYTNRQITNSAALSQSGANVKVYNFGKDIPTEGQNLGTPLGNPINVPTNQLGNVWRAFELDSRTGVLKPVINAPFGNVSSPASVPTVGQNAVTSGGTVGK